MNADGNGTQKATTIATKEAVCNAAIALTEAGQTPSVAAIRRRIGGGSYATIQALLMEWRETQTARRVPGLSLPESLADVHQRMGHDMWQRACALAREQLAGERESMKEAIDRHEVARQDAAAMADQLIADLDRVQGELDHEQRRAASASEELNEMRRELAAAQARFSELQEVVSNLRATESAAVERAAALHGRLEMLEAQNVALLARIEPPRSRRGPSGVDAAEASGA